MTELSDAKGMLRESLTDGDNGYYQYIEVVLEALDELENSYVPHLPAETDTWLRDSQDITLDHPLPPMSQVKFFYGPGRDQYLTVRATDSGLRVWSDHGWVTITPGSTNVVTITGSVK